MLNVAMLEERVGQCAFRGSRKTDLENSDVEISSGLNCTSKKQKALEEEFHTHDRRFCSNLN